MDAATLIKGLETVGFTPEQIQTMHSTDAQKAFVAKVNELYPNDEDEVPDEIINIYNDCGAEPIKDWHEPKPILRPKKLPPQCLPKPKPPVEPKSEKVKVKAPKKERMLYKVDMKEAVKGEATKWRGKQVTYSRIHACIDALKHGGTRSEIILNGDKLYVKNGGGSSPKEQERTFINVIRLLKILELVGFVRYDIRLKKYITEDSSTWKMVTQVRDARNEEAYKYKKSKVVEKVLAQA
jgi:hypothetical protein